MAISKLKFEDRQTNRSGSVKGAPGYRLAHSPRRNSAAAFEFTNEKEASEIAVGGGVKHLAETRESPEVAVAVTTECVEPGAFNSGSGAYRLRSLPRPSHDLSHSGLPVWLIPAERTPASEAFAPLWLAPADATILAIGRCDFLRMSAVAWVSNNQIAVAVDGHRSEAGRSVHVRIWTRDGDGVRRRATFQPSDERSVAKVVMGNWNGLPVAGLVLVPVIEQGEEW